MNVLDSFLRFQILVMMLFTRTFNKTLSLLKVGMLGCVTVDLSPPYQTALWGISSGCLNPGFISGMGPLVQEGSQKWSHEELVYEQSSHQPLPLPGQAC
jgi:hypothetical protein